MAPKKAVFLDIDGTLITRDGAMPASAHEALTRAKANGHEIVICSGRSPSQLGPVTSLFDFSGIVCAAGAYVSRGDDLIWHETMDAAHTNQLVTYFHDNDMAYFLQTEESLVSDTEATERMKQAFLDLGRTWDQVADLFGQMDVTNTPETTEGVEKCCYFQCTKDAKQVRTELGPYFDVVDSSYKVTRFCDGEITKAGVNKATGMQHYLDAVGLTQKDSIAVGDGPNDFEMVEYAQTGVCMGNGVDGLKAVADLVCPSIFEDGIYHAFQTLELI